MHGNKVQESWLNVYGISHQEPSFKISEQKELKLFMGPSQASLENKMLLYIPSLERPGEVKHY